MDIVKRKGGYAGGEVLGIPGNSGILAGEVRGYSSRVTNSAARLFQPRNSFMVESDYL